MLHAGLDSGRSSLVVTVVDEDGGQVDHFSVGADGRVLGVLVDRVGRRCRFVG